MYKIEYYSNICNSCRYILESGQYYVGIGSESDCRTYDFSQATDPTFATSAGNVNTGQLCTAFTLNLTSAYNPTCEYACNMWSNGVCGKIIGVDECTQTCLNDNWGWNYVDCIENAVVNSKFSVSISCVFISLFFNFYLFILFIYLFTYLFNPIHRPMLREFQLLRCLCQSCYPRC